ncbi:MAG TPA: rhomboid family intramembrane serine protease [Chloroflexota bacterium]
MIPYSDPSEPGRIFPWVNISLIVVNFLVFLYELSLQAQSTGTFDNFLYQYSLVPCEYTSHCTVVAGAPHPFWLALFTSMFMHGGWAHIFFNMLFLWVFGDNIENSMGHVRYLFFYLLCGLGANALEILTSVNSTVPGLGASGAIAGVLAAYLMLYPGSSVRTLILFGFIPIPVRLPAFILIGFWFVIQLFNGLAALSTPAANATGGVAYWAHVGGFVTGAVLIWFFRDPGRVQRLQAYHARPYGQS